MGTWQWPVGLSLVGLLLVVLLAACGPGTLSALGNPGDFCTEETACTDGTTCRAADDGYRCLGGSEGREKSPGPTDTPITVEDEEPEGPAPAVEEDASEDTSAGIPQDSSSLNFDEPEPEAADTKTGRYLPPSRRRGGGR